MPLLSTFDALAALAPFVLLMAFWILMTRRLRNTNPQNAIVEKLEEIRQELERLRRAVERQNG